MLSKWCYGGLLLLTNDDFYCLSQYSVFMLHIDIGGNVKSKGRLTVICSF